MFIMYIGSKNLNFELHIKFFPPKNTFHKYFIYFVGHYLKIKYLIDKYLNFATLHKQFTTQLNELPTPIMATRITDSSLPASLTVSFGKEYIHYSLFCLNLILKTDINECDNEYLPLSL